MLKATTYPTKQLKANRKHKLSLFKIGLVFVMLHIRTLADRKKGDGSVRVRNSPSLADVQVSFGGGCQLTATSSVLNPDPIDNTIILVTDSLSTTTMELQSAPLSEDDQTESKPDEGVLSCETPDMEELLPGTSYEDLKAIQSVQTFLAIGLSDTDSVTCSVDSACGIRYDWDYTPILWDVSPPDLYYGSTASIFITPKKAALYKIDGEVPFQVTLDRVNFGWNYDDCKSTQIVSQGAQRITGTVYNENTNENVQVKACFGGVGCAIRNKNSSLRCKFDGSDCYQTRVLPSVTSVSHSSGYTTGGQEITIKGYGFDHDDVKVTIHDIPCDVQCSDANQIVCLTGPKTLDPPFIPPAFYSGSRGVKRTHKGETKLWTSLEMPQDYEDSYTDHYSGFFDPPTSGNYQFHMSCDDRCEFKMSVSDPLNPAALQSLMRITSHTSFRKYQNVNKEEYIGSLFSEWVHLTEGTKYYFEMTHTEGGGDSHVTVGVEIEPDSGTHNYPIVTKQKMKLAVEQELVRDQIRVVVTLPDHLNFVMMYQDQSTLEYEKSESIEAGCTSSQFTNSVKGYYQKRFGTAPVVNVSCLGFDDLEIACSVSEDQIKSYVYLVETPRSMDGKSVENIAIVPIDTKATVTWEHVQTSSSPLSGFYQVRCFNKEGYYQDTQSLSYSANAGTVYNAIVAACPFLRDSFEVVEEGVPRFKEDGINFNFVFNDVDYELPQFEIIQLGSILAGNSPVVKNQILSQRGPNAWYEVIPIEMLSIADSKPQVVVTVGNLPAVCPDLNCGYTYEEPEGVITDVTIGECDFTNSSQDMYLTGDSLPQIFLHLKFINHGCEVIMQNLTHIHCTAPECFDTAGDWYPELETDKGPIPIDKTRVNPHSINARIDKVVPSQINPAGGETLHIEGSGFPKSLNKELKCKGKNSRDYKKDQENDGNHGVSVGLSDGTNCRVIETSHNQIACVPDPLVSRVERQSGTITDPIDVKVKVNGKSDQKPFDTLIQPYSVVSISPLSVSPIITRTIEIQLSDDFTATEIETLDFKVKIILRELGNVGEYQVIKQERPLNVVARDPIAKTLTIKYGGAYSGLYDVVVSTPDFNLFSSAQLLVILEVTDFQPRQGSQLGGTLVTIQGKHFSDIATDNPVKIGYEYISGTNHYCYVQETSEYQIKCRTAIDEGRVAGLTSLIVFAATYEEGACNVPEGCLYEYLDLTTLATLTSAEASYDPIEQKYFVIVHAENITDTDVSQVDVIIGGKAQSVIAVNETTIIAEVTSIDSGTTALPLEVFLSVGAVNGFNTVSSGLTFEPKLVSVETSQVSSAGSTIRARVIGLGIQDNFTLVEMGGTSSFCQDQRIVEYGVLECDTIAQTIIPTILGVYDYNSGLTFDCSAEDVNSCSLQTFDEVNQPSISSYDLSTPTTIVATGSNLALTEYNTCELTILGLKADTCSIDNNSQITAVFNLGVPASDIEVLPTITLFHIDGVTKQTVLNPQLNQIDSQTNQVIRVGIINTLSITGSTAGQTCSFNGGCLHEIHAQGLAARVKLDLSNVNVCGRTCEFREDLSTDQKVVCELPQIETTSSLSLFEIQKSLPMQGVAQAGWPLYMSLVYDGANMPGLGNTSANCWARFEFTSGYVALLDKFKFFMDEFTVKTLYVGNLKLQGSNDKFVTQIEDILTVGEEIHEGWNYYDMEQLGIEPKYSSYRIFNSVANGCRDIGEVVLTGKEIIDTSLLTHQCQVQVQKTTTSVETLTQSVTYSINHTPVLTNIQPKYGQVDGNTLVTFTGNWPSTQPSDYTIEIDDVSCTITDISMTELKCMTAPRLGSYPHDPKLYIFVEGYGRVATQNKVFKYVSLWSQSSTWGHLFPPVDGDSVAVPQGLHLLVDIDNSPLLNAVIVDGGSLIFPSNEDPNHHRTFDAKYIYVQHGLMEVGTEEEPYLSKLTITLHGDRFDPKIPLYGNKCLAVRYATLDIHGKPRDVVWTRLETTAEVGATQITLIESVDWQVGEKIVIAPTGYNFREAEERFIVGITPGSNPVITLDMPLEFKHYAGVDYYGASDFIEIRAEVALLSRNVVFRGDQETSTDNQYGAYIMLHSPGEETSIGRIENIELSEVGQVYLQNRYPINLHMLGPVHHSYVRGNSIHHSYNRGVTLNGISYLRLENNVFHDIMGHTIFLKNAMEVKNVIKDNLVILTQVSHSLMTSDMTPASFWITNPDNILVGNVAAGSEKHGFWYDLQPFSQGAYFDSKVCPFRTKLGEFRGNMAHSNSDHGLNIFSAFDPREFPCEPRYFDDNAYEIGENPYVGNQPVQATFENFVTYKNQKNGIYADGIGAVVFKGVKAADNKIAGVEVTTLEGIRDGMAWLEDAILVGQTLNNEEPIGSTYGVITPQRDGWFVTNSRFYNLNFNTSAALGSCSRCYCPLHTDSDCRQVDFSNLYFDSSVPRKIRYQYPYKGIYHDLDGTLTGIGPDTWATSYFKHNEQASECFTDMETYDGLLCDSSIQVRRIVLNKYTPSTLNNKMLYITQYDATVIRDMDPETYDAYMKDNTNFSGVAWRNLANPIYHWAMPMVTGHKYFFRWGEFGLDFTTMGVERVHWLWKPTDLKLHIVINHLDVRAGIDVVDNNGEVHLNQTMGGTNSWDELRMGDNLMQNDTSIRLINFIVSGFQYNISRFDMTAHRCYGSCFAAIDDVDLETEYRYWSQVSSWGSFGRVPIEGDDVVILPGWNMIYDIEESPKLSSLQIQGKLTFQNNGTARILRVYNLWVRSGILQIGTQEEPFTSKVRIILLGDYREKYWSFTNTIEAGNKNFVVTGTANLYGAPRDSRSILLQPLNIGSKFAYVETGLDWQSGERVMIATTNQRSQDSDVFTIETYDPFTGKVFFTETAKGFHFGDFKSTFEEYGVDMRAEVSMLDRMIVIEASTDDVSEIGSENQSIDVKLIDVWGCRILVADFFEQDFTHRSGSLNMDYVQVYNCSQRSTDKSAIKFQNAVASGSKITNCAISDGQAGGVLIVNSAQIELESNTISQFYHIGIRAWGSKNLKINRNWIMNIGGYNHNEILSRNYFNGSQNQLWGGWGGCVSISYGVEKVEMIGNIAAGCAQHGFHFRPAKCDDENPDFVFKNNIAHSIAGYGAVASSIKEKCVEVKDFIAYKVALGSIMLGTPSFTNRARNIISIDTGYGPAVFASNGVSEIYDSVSYAEFAKNPDCPVGSLCNQCADRVGIMATLSSSIGFPDSTSVGQDLYFHRGGDGSKSGHGYVYDHKFVGFDNQNTTCGARQVAISSYGDPNYTPYFQIIRPTFVDQAPDALAFLPDPDPEWQRVEECGDFMCTGPENVVIRVDKARYTYSGRLLSVDDDHRRRKLQSLTEYFAIASSNKQSTSTQVMDQCELWGEWNSYLCSGSTTGLLVFDSLDMDTFERAVQPVYVTDSQGTFKNKLNSFMNTCQGEAFGCRSRRSRFASVVDQNQDEFVLNFSSDPPKNMEFRLWSKYPSKGFLVSIQYPIAGSFQLFNGDHEPIMATDWDDNLKTWAKPTGKYCGEFRYEGVINRLQFWVEPYCLLYVKPRDAIQLKIRMEFTLEEFFSKGGVTTFIDRMAFVLGVHKADIRIVSVTQGSTIVEFIVFKETAESKESAYVPNIRKLFERLIKSNNGFMGSPVLDAEFERDPIKIDSSGDLFSSDKDGDGNGEDEKGVVDVLQRFKDQIEKLNAEQRKQLEEQMRQEDLLEEEMEKSAQVTNQVEIPEEKDVTEIAFKTYAIYGLIALMIVGVTCILGFVIVSLKKQRGKKIEVDDALKVVQTDAEFQTEQAQAESASDRFTEEKQKEKQCIAKNKELDLEQILTVKQMSQQDDIKLTEVDSDVPVDHQPEVQILARNKRHSSLKVMPPTKIRKTTLNLNIKAAQEFFYNDTGLSPLPRPENIKRQSTKLSSSDNIPFYATHRKSTVEVVGELSSPDTKSKQLNRTRSIRDEQHSFRKDRDVEKPPNNIAQLSRAQTLRLARCQEQAKPAIFIPGLEALDEDLKESEMLSSVSGATPLGSNPMSGSTPTETKK